jgi:flagellar operon protein
LINKINSSQLNRIDINNSRTSASNDFGKLLESIQNKNQIKISAHAQVRLKERNINLSESDINKIQTAVNSIKAKGGRDALILYNNVAYITSVNNNTIVTAVSSDNLKDNIFTNIDSAMIL